VVVPRPRVSEQLAAYYAGKPVADPRWDGVLWPEKTRAWKLAADGRCELRAYLLPFLAAFGVPDVCTGAGVHFHHKTYDHAFAEHRDDVVYACKPCHALAHRIKDELRVNVCVELPG
jgi:hypothetical protein